MSLEGSGSATVVTPSDYGRGRRDTVTIGSQSSSERADRHGRLAIAVPLGPSDTVQEYPLGGPPLGTTVHATHVEVSRG